MSDKSEKTKWRDWVRGNTQEPITLQKEVMLANNPQGRVYVVGMKLKDLFYLKFVDKNNEEDSIEFSFFTDVFYCIVTKFPFFEYHRDFLMNVYSKITNWRLNEYSYLKKMPKSTIYSKLNFYDTIKVIF